MQLSATIEKVLRHDRILVLAGLISIIALAWSYLVWLALQMTTMGDMMTDMVQIEVWTIADALSMFVMWAIMMTAMMIPSATPVILLYARFVRKKMNDQPYAPTATFFVGYLAVWVIFSAAATLLQWALSHLALLNPMMLIDSPYLGGAILIFAGIYQWMPSKQACLKHCRTPVEFLSKFWKPGAKGAFLMGLRHGTYCLGCCWILMLLLFVTGVMNLAWVAIIAIFVLIEKLAPFGRRVGQIGALLLIGAGIASFILV